LSERFPRESERFKDFLPEVFREERSGNEFAIKVMLQDGGKSLSRRNSVNANRPGGCGVASPPR